MTSGAVKKEAASQEEAVSADVTHHVFERDPRNYGESMKSKKRNEWKIAMREKLDTLKETKCSNWRSDQSTAIFSIANGSIRPR